MTTTTPRAGRRLRKRFALGTGALALALTGTAFAATTAVTDPPELVTDTYAFVGGIVNPDGNPTVYTFQYGETTDYGQQTPVTSAGNGKAEVPVNISLDDLKPATVYHYRLIAYPDPAAGSSYGVAQILGSDQTFTTAPSLAIAFAGKTAKVSGERAAVSLSAVGPPGIAAQGKLTLKAKVGKKSRAIGSARYRVGVNKTKTVSVRLARAAVNLIKDGQKIKATASAKTKGIATPVTSKLTLQG